MIFEAGTLLVLLILIPAFVALFIWHERQRERRLIRFADRNLLPGLLLTHRRGRRWLRHGVWLLSLASLITALARPTWGIAEEVVEAQGIAVIVVLDVSASMDAQDIVPSRIQRAKRAASEFFQGADGNQLGLILFAGSAFVQFPLTTDTSAALTFLNSASTRSISHQGTALADAVELAVATFDDRIVSHGVVVILSDGENHQGDPVAAAQLAEERGLVIHAIGYGNPDEGAPIPIMNPDGTFANDYKTDQGGALVVSRLEEDILRDTAEITGGTYQRASDSGIEVVNLLNELSKIEGSVFERRLQTRRIERFELFVALALILLTFEFGLAHYARADDAS